jgi:hypothetical protein
MKRHRSATTTQDPAPTAQDAGPVPADEAPENGWGSSGNPFRLSSDVEPAPVAADAVPDPAPDPVASSAPDPTVATSARASAVPAEPDVRPGTGPAAPVASGSPVTQADRRDALDLTAVAPNTGPPPAGFGEPAPGFLSPAPPRLRVESALVRLIATAGVVGIGTAVGAILVANNVAGWITGLSVSLVSVILAAVLWRSRRL